MILQFGLFVYYAVKTLLFEEKISHFGPFPDDNKTVRFVYRYDNGEEVEIETHDQPVTLFDKIRQYIHKPYRVVVGEDGHETWFVIENKIEVWTCPKCLSFWMSIPVFLYVLFSEKDLLKALIYAGSAAGFSAFLNQYEDLQARQATPPIVDFDLDEI